MEYAAAGAAAGAPMIKDFDVKESDAAKGEYKKRREAAGFERDAVLGLLDLDLFNVPTSEKDCFMHVYLGMSKVLGGLPDSLKARSVEEDPFKAAADLRGLLRGRVQSMLARAEEAGALVGDKNTLKEWMDSLRGGQPVNVSLFEMVAEEHNVDIYVLQPEVNRQTRQGFLHALRFSAVEEHTRPSIPDRKEG
ncbi:hypothetical protein CVIRNUC_011169 [Coccomyxa viridis]|uniref:Uncharacterized protein n=1 Tax=Coccomyxa viridis TaxID=1274662 RepID=A0AAV1INV0_9CHLO|nr:hypothetical protein CVIRNUC_011169 [Coccomyxa viridis]